MNKVKNYEYKSFWTVGSYYYFDTYEEWVRI